MTARVSRQRLPLTEPFVTLLCIPIVAATRIGLTVVGFKRLSKWGQSVTASDLGKQAGYSDLHRIGAAISRASRLIPGASCLTQALAARYYLRQLGLDSELRIGVAKDETGRFTAHAWLDCRGMTVVGGDDSPAKYIVMPGLNENRL